jgi:hypothetical protein
MADLEVEDTSGYGEQNEDFVSESQIETAPTPVGDEDPYAFEEQALANELAGDGVVVSSIETEATPIDPEFNPYLDYGAGVDVAVPTADILTQPGAVNAQTASLPGGTGGTFTGPLFGLNAAGQAAGAALGQAAGRIVGQVTQAQNQQNNSNLAQMPLNTDWRVTLRIAPGANYLYKSNNPGILAPLKVTDGVIFPYTPTISTAYKANYDTYDLTHSNYRGYFYKSSNTDAVTINATFTAQSTSDAQYVLAVIHFFRSVTKMFYGQDPYRGSPPPLVFLSGLGDYQFNNHPCVVGQFNYTLPPEVDYISTGAPSIMGLNLSPLQNLYSTTLNAISPTAVRLASALLPPGAQSAIPAPLRNLLNNPTYVPSKLEIVLTLLPIQTRQQVSQVFSNANYNSGQGLKGGFW